LQELLAALQGLAPIEALRFARWGYAAVNTLHVLGIALLVGGSLPLALRLVGFWPAVPRAALARVLALSAGIGLGLALATGFLLFATRAPEYARNPAFQIKLALIAIGTASALVAHRRHGWTLENAPDTVARRTGAVSIVCWLGVLVAGRLIAFVQG
jgi:hypothetical protein